MAVVRGAFAKLLAPGFRKAMGRDTVSPIYETVLVCPKCRSDMVNEVDMYRCEKCGNFIHIRSREVPHG